MNRSSIQWKSSATPLYGVLSTAGSTCTKTVLLSTKVTNHWRGLPLFPMHMGEDEDGSICYKMSVFKS